jgi:hypothetical protein
MFGILFLMRELYDLTRTTKTIRNLEWLFKFIQNKKLTSPIELDSLTESQQGVIFHAFFSLLVMVWVVVGILTSNWILFASYLLFMIGIINPLSKFVRTKFGFGKAYTATYIFDTIVGILLVGFAIVNHYHLKIDLVKLLSLT